MADQPTTLTDQATGAEEKATGGFDDLIATGIGDAGAGEEHSAGPASTEDATETGNQEETSDAGEETAEAENADTDGTEGDEASLLPTEEEADFSQAVYERYAKHYKDRGIEYDLNDPKDRNSLREIISRGQALKRLQEQQAKPDEAAADDATGEDGKDEGKEAAPEKETPEQVRQFLKDVDRFVESRIVPEVAEDFATDLLTALWPEAMKKGEIKVTPQLAHGVTKVFTKFGHLLLNSELGAYADHAFQRSMEQHYPLMSRVHDSAIDEQAIENLESRSEAGQPAYPDLAELINSGAISKTFKANPWIRQTKYADAKGKALSPVANRERQLEIAVRMARGERVNPTLLKKAVETGKKQAEQRANTKKAGKLAGGESKGSFQSGGKPGDDARTAVLEGGGSKFSQAIEESGIREKSSQAHFMRNLTRSGGR